MCDEPPVECAIRHLGPKFKLRNSRLNKQWNGPCPLCQSPKSLSLTIDRGRKLWHCNRKPKPGKPACSQDELIAKLADELPSCITAAKTSTRTKRPRPDIRDQVTEIVLDTTTSAATLRLRLLMLSEDLTAREAAAKLGYSRSTFYAAAGNLGRGKR